MIEVDLEPLGPAPKETICGEIVVYRGLVSPLGDLDPSTGRLRGVGSVKSRILVVRGFTGSTVGPYIVYSLRKRGLAPRVLIVEQVDANVVASATIAEIPLYRIGSVEGFADLLSKGGRIGCVEGNKLRMRGIVIAIEGLDGAGKTTVARRLLEGLRSCGYDVTYTYEPYYDDIRRVFESGSVRLTPFVEALLMVADRYAHYEEVIRREVELGKVVILDRYKHSTLAYQGAGGVPIEWLRELQKYLPDPELGIYLDVDPEEGLRRRMGSSTRSLTYFENLDRLKRAREIYVELSSRGELVMVDSSAELSSVVREVVEVIEDRFGLVIRGCSTPQ